MRIIRIAYSEKLKEPLEKLDEATRDVKRPFEHEIKRRYGGLEIIYTQGKEHAEKPLKHMVRNGHDKKRKAPGGHRNTKGRQSKESGWRANILMI